MFDVPETDMGEASQLILWRGQVLRVTVEPELDEVGRKGTKKHF